MPVLVPAGAYLLAVAWAFQRSVERSFVANDSFEFALWSAQALALSLLALGATWEWVRARRTRAALAALSSSWSAPLPRGRSARRCHGGSEILPGAAPPSARRPAGRHRWTSASSEPGHAAHAARLPRTYPGGDRAQTRSVRRFGTRRRGCVRVRLALENERLHAELRAQLEELRASRARIVEAGDIERRRLERDLHDGVQQRLVTLSLAVGLAIAEHGDDPKLARAQQELRLLLAELRELAHGIYPVALAEEDSQPPSRPWRSSPGSLSGSGADSRRSGSMRRSKRPHTWSSARWPATSGAAGPPSTRIARAAGARSERRRRPTRGGRPPGGSRRGSGRPATAGAARGGVTCLRAELPCV